MLSMGISMLNSRLAEIRQQADPPFTGASAGYGDFFVAKTKVLSVLMPAAKLVVSNLP